jgi:hypothetical protein
MAVRGRPPSDKINLSPFLYCLFVSLSLVVPFLQWVPSKELEALYVIQGQTTFRQNKTWSAPRLQLYYFSW